MIAEKQERTVYFTIMLDHLSNHMYKDIPDFMSVVVTMQKRYSIANAMFHFYLCNIFFGGGGGIFY